MDSAPTIDSPLAEREVAYERFVRQHLKRNYAAHYLHGMLGMTGFRLVNAPTFVPAYLFALSGSKAAVGFGLALGAIGAVLSPIIGANQVEHRTRVLPIAVWIGAMMRLQVLGLGLSGFFLSGQSLLVAVIGFLFLLGIFSGAQRVTFQLLLGKVIPLEMRGRLQAWRNVTGGLIAAGISYLAGRYILGADLFGNGYGTTFLLAFVLTSLGLTAMRLLMREPEPPFVRAQMPLAQRLREFPGLLRANVGLRHFLIAQGFAMAGRIAVPFYILYASDVIALTGANLGLLSLAYLGADTAANLAWGYAGDKLGFRAVLITALSLLLGSTVLLMNAHDFTVVFLSFMALGAAQSGYMMSVTTIILELGERHEMAMRLALSTTTEGIMTAAGPLLGGIIAAQLGYGTLFGTSIACVLAALLLLVFLVKEPRKQRMVARASRTQLAAADPLDE